MYFVLASSMIRQLHQGKRATLGLMRDRALERTPPFSRVDITYVDNNPRPLTLRNRLVETIQYYQVKTECLKYRTLLCNFVVRAHNCGPPWPIFVPIWPKLTVDHESSFTPHKCWTSHCPLNKHICHVSSSSSRYVPLLRAKPPPTRWMWRFAGLL